MISATSQGPPHLTPGQDTVHLVRCCLPQCHTPSWGDRSGRAPTSLGLMPSWPCAHPHGDTLAVTHCHPQSSGLASADQARNSCFQMVSGHLGRIPGDTTLHRVFVALSTWMLIFPKASSATGTREGPSASIPIILFAAPAGTRDCCVASSSAPNFPSVTFCPP